MMSLLSRFQPQHAAMFFLDIPRNIRPKKAGLILTAGSRKNEDRAMPMFAACSTCSTRVGTKATGHLQQYRRGARRPRQAAMAAARRLGEYLNEDWPRTRICAICGTSSAAAPQRSYPRSLGCHALLRCACARRTRGVLRIDPRRTRGVLRVRRVASSALALTARWLPAALVSAASRPPYLFPEKWTNS